MEPTPLAGSRVPAAAAHLDRWAEQSRKAGGKFGGKICPFVNLKGQGFPENCLRS
jgi:hypothetical protein